MNRSGTGAHRGAGTDRERGGAPDTIDLLERRYRRWLRVYPKPFRQHRGEELLGTLLELSRPGQRRPTPTQVAAVPLAGVLLLVQAAVQGLVGAIETFAVRSSGATYTYALGEESLSIAWSLLPLLPLAAVRLRRYRVAVALALLPPAVTLAFLVAGTSAMPAAYALVRFVGCAPAVLLVPWLLRRPEPEPRRWQIGVPSVCIALPVLASAAWTPAVLASGLWAAARERAR